MSSTMSINDRGELIIQDAKTFWRNFSGHERKFNAEGTRNFCVRLDVVIADILKAKGWNVKYIPARDDDDIDTPYIQVAVRYGRIAPRIYMIAGRNKTQLNESIVGDLDYAEIETADLIIRGHEWDVGHVKAYLKTGYFTIVRDEFADKYDFDENEDELLF